MSQDVKIFDSEVWGSNNIQTKTFNIEGHDHYMLKALNSKV